MPEKEPQMSTNGTCPLCGWPVRFVRTVPDYAEDGSTLVDLYRCENAQCPTRDGNGSPFLRLDELEFGYPPAPETGAIVRYWDDVAGRTATGTVLAYREDLDVYEIRETGKESAGDVTIERAFLRAEVTHGV